MIAADQLYHIYNRGNNRERLFYKEENYQFFLDRYNKYLKNRLNTYCYCLLPNHFHLLIKSKGDSPKCISEQFRRFFISYAQSINKQENRTGSLFQKSFNRKVVTSKNQLIWLVYYIHRNPVHHGLTKHLGSYRWSSYGALDSNLKTSLRRTEVLDWFGGRKAFKNFHRQNIEIDLKKIYNK